MNTQERLRKKRLEQELKIKQRKEAEQLRLEEKRLRLASETNIDENNVLESLNAGDKTVAIVDDVATANKTIAEETSSIKQDVEEVTKETVDDVKSVIRKYHEVNGTDFPVVVKLPINYNVLHLPKVDSMFADIELYDSTYHKIDTTDINDYIANKVEKINNRVSSYNDSFDYTLNPIAIVKVLFFLAIPLFVGYHIASTIKDSIISESSNTTITTSVNTLFTSPVTVMIILSPIVLIIWSVVMSNRGNDF